ncbi:MAG: NUDIX hydrolase [Clostridiales bacterium]|nr:NUDIX hydrolase [Clostridiales bacterium]MDU3243799.1 NUDIX hydrolase [Clostridiales bacterium]
MSRIRHIDKLTDSRHLNMYELEARNRLDNPVDYFVASRAKEIDDLKISTHNLQPDGVIIYSLYGDKQDKVILIRQYRYAIDGYIYEFPAGLVDPGEDYRTAGARELKEETGLDFHPVKVDEMYEKPYFTTIGMTDECCASVYGYATGEVSKDGLEDNEDIEVVIADRDEVRRILKEERVAIMCAYMLMHFLKDQDDPFAFLK